MSQAHHSAPPPPPEASGRPDRRRGLLVAWAAALVMGIAAGGVAIWQVSDEIYTPRHTAQEYWETISQGSGSETLGFFDPASLEFITEPDASGALAARGLIDGEPAIAYATDATVMGGVLHPFPRDAGTPQT